MYFKVTVLTVYQIVLHKAVSSAVQRAVKFEASHVGFKSHLSKMFLRLAGVFNWRTLGSYKLSWMWIGKTGSSQSVVLCISCPHTVACLQLTLLQGQIQRDSYLWELIEADSSCWPVCFSSSFYCFVLIAPIMCVSFATEWKERSQSQV